MKDQVDALDVAGVPATFLNSSLIASTPKTDRHHDLFLRFEYYSKPSTDQKNGHQQHGDG
jgi:hypothetical protein